MVKRGISLGRLVGFGGEISCSRRLVQEEAGAGLTPSGAGSPMPSPTALKAELLPSFSTLPTRRDCRVRETPRGFREVLECGVTAPLCRLSWIIEPNIWQKLHIETPVAHSFFELLSRRADDEKVTAATQHRPTDRGVATVWGR